MIRPTDASAAQSQVVTRHCPNGVVAFARIETCLVAQGTSALSLREGTAGAQFLTAEIGLTVSR
jgi:hypothetical protein